ncbi:hypothetical protein LCGC14_1104780 [marine sediment metagenome]|uniref:Uncharacterized protein n=1 Tax=marine sediment metagenome TaxID=412755 RepID=A0A0F9MD43_9ZZZZ
MAHHRCTRCKQEADIRHKAYQGLFCEDCLREIRGMGSMGRRRISFGSLWDNIWYSIRALANMITAPFKLKIQKRDEQRQRQVKVAYSTMKAKALKIPMNPNALSPQKR